MKRYRQKPSERATKAGVTFANRARREADIMQRRPDHRTVKLSPAEEKLAIEQFLLDKAL